MDYGKFGKLKGNRPIHPQNVRSLVAQLKRNNKLKFFPLTVDADFRVIDGQHRLEAAKLLNVEVYYQIDPDGDIVTTREVNTVGIQWSLHDFLNNFLENNESSYTLLNSFWKNNEKYLTLPQAIFLWCGAIREESTRFKEGQMQIGDILVRNNTLQFIQAGNELSKSATKNSHLHRAIYYLYECGKIDMDKVFHVLERNPNIVEYMPHDHLKIIRLIEERYNQSGKAYLSLMKSVRDSRATRKKNESRR